MKFQSLIRYALGLACAILLASCGGGGATAPTPIDTGQLSITPAAATWYAGVANQLCVNGQSKPYRLTSSEPSLLPVPESINGNCITLVPNNPSVVDAGLPPDALQVRTVIITARSAEGNTATAEIKVAQNFLTGYGFAFISSTCAGASPCAGGETAILFDATVNGNIQPNRTYRLERVRGPFQFVDPLNSNVQYDAITVTSDSEGKFTAVIRVAAGVPTQVGVIRITDVRTGAYVDQTFTISGTPATGALTVIPTSILLTGPNATTCGFGTVDVLVFDGVTPYTATCPSPQILVTNPTSTSQPGRFSVLVGANTNCLTAEQCVITDATGARTTFTITTVKGTSPPVTPISAVPDAITLACGTTGQALVVGGSGSYIVASSHPRVTASVSGNTISITRLTGDAGVVYPTTATISVSDGSATDTILVTIPVATCP